MSRSLKYFAYGSNMHPLRLRQRVASCRALGVAQLKGYTLRFHKQGRDHSGKCNVLYTGAEAHRVLGVVYEMRADHKPHLDHAEGLGKGYNAATLSVVSEEAEHRVFLYVADSRYVDDALKPYGWYKALVLEGARAHRLPAPYLAEIERVEATDDPDPARSELHLGILAGGIEVR